MTYSGHATSSTVSAEALTKAAISLLGMIIPAPARRSPHEGFFRPAVGVGDIVAAVAVKHLLLLTSSGFSTKCNYSHKRYPGASPK
jgi:hypothetical protein